eukprot:NODE_2744_length_405_cov_43.151685_g2662_i0.p1 GENE.NODE_2744_length_405_cov_43.151685_g2662_i0~~NODE_2744_length_405_cov_43.151685_g2662_i0.p1  ORF type:complete len:88 (-),score=27.27 NODE_2744_length_405_cov_43.151685_g2662_i0:142-378(-)
MGEQDSLLGPTHEMSMVNLQARAAYHGIFSVEASLPARSLVFSPTPQLSPEERAARLRSIISDAIAVVTDLLDDTPMD